jgi:hypothetical protein
MFSKRTRHFFGPEPLKSTTNRAIDQSQLKELPGQKHFSK